MKLRNRRTEVRLTEDEYARIKKQSAKFSSIGHYIRSAINEFSDVNAREKLAIKNELATFYREYRDDISHISGNLNQSVKRANELAVAGLLTASYISQVLLPEIQTFKKTLESIHQELIKVTKKAINLR